MSEHCGIGRVHVIGPKNRCGIRGKCGEGGQDAPARLGLAASLRRIQDAGTVDHAGSGEGEGLGHAVAVEPMSVAVAVALVLGRTVPPQDAGELGWQAAAQRRQRSSKLFRARRLEADQSRVSSQCRGEIFPGAGHSARREQDRQAPDRAQRGAAG